MHTIRLFPKVALLLRELSYTHVKDFVLKMTRCFVPPDKIVYKAINFKTSSVCLPNVLHLYSHPAAVTCVFAACA